MATLWNYLRGTKKEGSPSATASSQCPQNALDLLISETAIQQQPTGIVREGKTFLPPQTGPANFETPKCVATLVGHSERIWGLAWHPSGDLLVSCGGDKTARLWLRTPKKIGSNTVHKDEDAAATSPGNVTDSMDYDFQWQCVHIIENEHSGTIRTASWSADGSRLALCSFDGTISIWVVEIVGSSADQQEVANKESDSDEEESKRAAVSVELEMTLDGHESEVKGVAWYTDSYNYNYMNDLHLAQLASKDRASLYGDAADVDNATQTSDPSTTVQNLITLASQRLIAPSDSPNTTKIINARRSLQLATCSRDRSVWVWEGKTKGASNAPTRPTQYPTIVPPPPLGVEYECAGVLTGHPQDIKSVSWVPSAVLLGTNAHGPLLAEGTTSSAGPSLQNLPPAGSVASGALLSSSYDDTVRVWEEHKVRKDDWDCVQTLAGHDGTVWEAAVQPNAEIIERISLIDNATSPVVLEWKHAIPTNPIVVTVSDDGRLIAWQREIAADQDANKKVNYIQVGSAGGFADGRTLYSASWAPAHITSLPEGQVVKTHLASTFALGISDIVAVGTGNDSFALFRVCCSESANLGTAGLVNVNFEQLCIAEHAHNAEVNCVRFCPVSKSKEGGSQSTIELATASDDGEVKIWSMHI